MKILRQQLDEARGEYRALQYPGDLADELCSTGVSPVKPNPWRITHRVAVVASMALAACFVILIWTRHSNPPTIPIAKEHAPAAVVFAANFNFTPPPMPAMPSGSLTPPAPPPMPAMPSLEHLPSLPTIQRDVQFSIFNFREQS